MAAFIDPCHRLWRDLRVEDFGDTEHPDETLAFLDYLVIADGEALPLPRRSRRQPAPRAQGRRL